MEISKVQLTRYGGLEISYATVEDMATTTTETGMNVSGNPMEYKIKSMAAPHPDLTKLFENLVVIVADLFGMVSLDSLLTVNATPEHIGTLDETAIAEFQEKNQSVLERIRVKGVEWTSGHGVIIHWEWYAKNNAVAKCATPKIKLDGTFLGYEEYLGNIVARMQTETELYLKGSKRAQLSLFDADGQPTDEATDNDDETV